MSSEHDYSVYGQYEQHKLCCYSGLLQASWWNRNGLFDRHLQFQYRRDLMHGLFGRHLQFKSWFDLMHAMSSEHDYGVYGQHKLCYCSGVLQAG